jgi:D-alanine-D-alanine ligase
LKKEFPMATVVLLFNQVSARDTTSELDVLRQCSAVESSLLRMGHRVHRIACTLDLATTRQNLLELQPDVVFNLVEALGGTDQLMGLATLLLESLRIPFTGSSSLALQLTTRKPLAKQRLTELRLPTPAWLLATDPGWRGLTPGRSTPSKALVKAAAEHASLGLSENSVIDCRSPLVFSSLRQSIESASAEFGTPFFAEEYIHGREFNLSLLGGILEPQVLFPAEIRFEGYSEDRPRILGAAAKWNEDSPEYHRTVRTFSYSPADQPLLDELGALARSCWSAFGLNGYARVDFRVDADGQPWVLEINANPCLSPDAGFAAALERSGMTWDEAVEAILDDALRSDNS